MQRIFVVGCPRSGTTLLQSLLAAHPQVIGFPESDVFRYLDAGPRPARWLGLAGEKARRNYARLLAQIESPVAGRPSHFARPLARAFVAALDAHARGRGASAWVEKTVQNLSVLPRIEQLVSGAHFVHLLRDGKDTIASLYDVYLRHPRTWGRLGGLQGCVERWTHDARLSRAALGRPGHVFVRYERLVSEPRATLEALCAALGLLFDEAMLKGHRRAARELILEHEVWKHEAAEPIRADRPHKGDVLFDPAQRREVAAAVALGELDAWLPVSASPVEGAGAPRSAGRESRPGEHDAPRPGGGA